MGFFQNIEIHKPKNAAMWSAIMGMLVATFLYGFEDYYDYANRVAGVVGGTIGFMLIPWLFASLVFFISWIFTKKSNPSLLALTAFWGSVILLFIMVVGQCNLWKLGI